MTVPDIAGLCERLRAPTVWQSLASDDAEWEIRSDPFRAADTIERQAAEIERLRGALTRTVSSIEAMRPTVSRLLDEGHAYHDQVLDEARAALTGEDRG